MSVSAVQISIHALLAESDVVDTLILTGSMLISIHALLAESDFAITDLTLLPFEFLSTLSLRRATLMWYQCNTVVKISIHALLAESDECNNRFSGRVRHFYPRSPCGERPCHGRVHQGRDYFYPRSPCGERPLIPHQQKCRDRISIHALLAESDCAPSITPATSRNFYPRSPCGERLMYTLIFANPVLFLSTLSLRRATFSVLVIASDIIHFYPRSPCGERPRDSRSVPRWHAISIHALLAESDVLPV